jgi:hypothetical protein
MKTANLFRTRPDVKTRGLRGVVLDLIRAKQKTSASFNSKYTTFFSRSTTDMIKCKSEPTNIQVKFLANFEEKKRAGKDREAWELSANPSKRPFWNPLLETHRRPPPSTREVSILHCVVTFRTCKRSMQAIQALWLENSAQRGWMDATSLDGLLARGTVNES